MGHRISIWMGLISLRVPRHRIYLGICLKSRKKEKQRATWHGVDIKRCESRETASFKVTQRDLPTVGSPTDLCRES